MQLGLVGLGKMGFNMRERLREGGHEVIGYDPRPEVIDVPTLAALAEALESPRVVWVMVPSGPITDGTITDLAKELSEGDLVIDGGNSRYTEDEPHAKLLGEKGIAFIDAGVSGGIWGLKEGYGLMVGGSDADVERAMPIFDTLRPPGTAGRRIRARRPRRGGAFRQDGAQRHRVRADDGIRRGLRGAGRRGPDQGSAGRLPGVDQRHGGAVMAAAAAGQGAQGGSRPQGDLRLHRRLRRRSVDGGGGDPAAGARARASRRRCSPGSSSRQDDSPTMKAVAALRNQFGGHAVKRISESG